MCVCARARSQVAGMQIRTSADAVKGRKFDSRVRVHTFSRRAPSYSSMQGSERLEENGACASEQQRVVDALSAGASLHTGLDVYKDAVRYVDPRYAYVCVRCGPRASSLRAACSDAVGNMRMLRATSLERCSLGAKC